MAAGMQISARNTGSRRLSDHERDVRSGEGAEYNLRAPMDSPVTAKATDAELANSIRALAMDAVEAAKSGHPGMPMGMAEIAVALWKRHLRHNPANPTCRSAS